MGSRRGAVSGSALVPKNPTNQVSEYLTSVFLFSSVFQSFFVQFRQSKTLKLSIFRQESDGNKIIVQKWFEHFQHAHIWAYIFWFITLVISVRFRQSRALKLCIFCQEFDTDKFLNPYPVCQKVPYAHIWAYTFNSHNLVIFDRFRLLDDRGL